MNYQTHKLLHNKQHVFVYADGVEKDAVEGIAKIRKSAQNLPQNLAQYCIDLASLLHQ